MRKRAKRTAVLMLLMMLALSAGVTAYASGMPTDGIENDVSEENDSRFGSTSPWLSGMEGSIYENPVDAGEEEQDISVSSPGWVEENIAELFRNMGSSLIELLQDNMGASIDSIIYGRVGSGRPNSVNIYAFELRKGNPYGVTAAVCYSLLRGMMFVFLGVCFVFQLAKAAWSGQTAKSREEIKAQLPILLMKFCAMTLMPHLLDAAIYIRDVLLYGIKEVTGQMVTGGATLSLSKAFLINAERSGTFVDAVMYLGTVVLTIYFVFLYVAVAIDMLVCFVSFPFICVLHGRKRDLIGSWVATVFSNLMTPVVDAVLLLVPLLTSLMLSDVVRGVAVIQLVMCMLIIPARIRFKALLGIQSNDRNGFLGAMAVMTFARALASGVKRGAGRIADAVSDARRSRAHGELAEADREEEAALLSSDTGGTDGGRAAERPGEGVENARMPEDMAGDSSRMPEGTDWDAHGESALYEGEGAAMDMDYGYSGGPLPEEGYGEGGAGGSAMEMEPEYSEEPRPEEGYSESAVEGSAMDTASGHSEELQPEESYRESAAEGPSMDTASVDSEEPQPEKGHKESAAGDMPHNETAGTGQPGLAGHGGTARAAEGGASGSTGNARIEALREADRKVENSQNALDRLRMERAENMVKDKQLKRNMLDYARGSEEYKNLEKQRADVENRTAVLDKKIAMESGRLNRLRRQSGEMHSAFGMKSTPTEFEERRAEILRKKANISNFEQPEFKGILSNEQMRTLYRNRAIAGGVKALAGTAGTIAGGTIGGSSAIFLGGSAVALAAAGGMQAGGDVAEVSVDAVLGAGRVIRRGAQTAGKGAYRAAERAASAYLLGKMLPAAVQVQIDGGKPDSSGTGIGASPGAGRSPKPMAAETVQTVPVEVPDTYPDAPGSAAEAGAIVKAENMKAQIAYDVSRVIGDAVSQGGDVVSGSMLHVLQRANIRLEREIAVMREEGAFLVTEEVIRERRAAIRIQMLSEAIVDSMERMGYQKGTEEYAEAEELVREKIGRIFEENEKPLI